MSKLTLEPIVDAKPVKLTVELSGAVHHDLVVYAEILSRETN